MHAESEMSDIHIEGEMSDTCYLPNVVIKSLLMPRIIISRYNKT